MVSRPIFGGVRFKTLALKGRRAVKKLLAMALIGGLFSLGCTENTTKPEPKKGSPAPSRMKSMGGDAKDDATPKDNDKAKDEAGKKDEKKDETPKKDADKKDKK
jgi:hypothetical protein